MNRKDILELKRRFKKDECTFTKMCGCYVNGEKKILLEFRETFLNLAEEEFFKYLEISRKVLSGTVGNNLLELNFTPDTEGQDHQKSLMQLKRSGLKDDTLLHSFYDSIIQDLDYTGNFLILVFHDVYDVMTKTSDNLKLDESEEVYEYMLCAICPVSLSKPGLGYFNDEHKIKSRIRDWVVGAPTLGFVYPAFIDRSSDIDGMIYYTKNAKDAHPELMEKALGCSPKKTATVQKQTFESIIQDNLGTDDLETEKIFGHIQDNLNTMVEEAHEMYQDTTMPSMTLSKEKVRDLLIDSGVSEEITTKVADSYEDVFEDTPPFAEHLIDKKIIKANAQKKKEEELLEQVENLESTLEKMTLSSLDDSQETSNEDFLEDSDINSDEDSNEENQDIETSDLDQDDDSDYDLVLHVKPDKLAKIKTQIINGERCLVVPFSDKELANINGRKGLDFM